MVLSFIVWFSAMLVRVCTTKVNLPLNKVHPEGKYKVSPAHIDDIDDATNVSDTVQTIGSSEASVANPNISID